MTIIKNVMTMLVATFSSSLLAQPSDVQSPAGDGAAPVASTLASSDQMWTTSYGTTRLPSVPRSGMLVRTSYSQDNGRIYGTLTQDLSGKWTLDGEWEEGGSGRDCGGPGRYAKGPSWGKIRFVFNAQFTKFDGSWGYCKDDPGAKWSGSRDTSVAAPRPPVSSTANVESSGEGSGKEARVAKPAVKEAEQKRRRCDLAIYTTSLNLSTGRDIKNFTNSTETVARYDAGLPGARLYPSPVENSGDIPSFLEAEDFLVLEKLEALTNEMVSNRGPDDWLKEKRKQIRELHVIARDRYEGAAKRAADAFKPCPTYLEPAPYSHLAEADRVMAALRERRDKELTLLLAESERLNEALTREFYSELANTNSLADKAKAWVRKEIAEVMRGERVEPRKIEALTPRLEALQDVYQRLEAEGSSVSEEQRDRDLASALKESGIDYDASQNRHPIRDGAIKVGRKTFGYIGALIKEAYAPDILKLSLRAAGYVALAKDTAEIINALKNLNDLWDVRQELMPTTLAVAEDRAYLLGLMQRYDIVEDEYKKLRKFFENSIKSSGEKASREW